MEYLAVLVAAAGAYAFGAVWYMWLGDSWMQAAGLRKGPDGRPEGFSPMPFVISAISVIVVAGMMRHVFKMSSLDTLLEGLMGGFGLGAFIVAPWIVTNYAYAMRPRNLSLIDCGYAIIGCTIMGILLTLF